MVVSVGEVVAFQIMVEGMVVDERIVVVEDIVVEFIAEDTAIEIVVECTPFEIFVEDIAVIEGRNTVVETLLNLCR